MQKHNSKAKKISKVSQFWERKILTTL